MSTLAHDFVNFLRASPTPYHAVSNAKTMLIKAGFRQLLESSSWTDSKSLVPGGKYFVTRNGSSIIAFTVGGKWKAGNAASMCAAHTDSPTLRIKPNSKRTAEGYLQVGVETYGGLLAHTWFDRDLSIAGRVMVEKNGSFEQRLIKVDKPILRIPTLAIHLDRSVNEAFKFNKETHMAPILGQLAAQKLNEPSEGIERTTMEGRHHPALLDLLVKELNVENVSKIHDFELVLYDTQDACIGGLNDEFIFSARLDNLGCTYASVKGLIDSLDTQNLEEDDSIRLISCFDHEEIGSLSQQGADSNFLPTILLRINDNDTAKLAECSAKSFLISADMAHAVNPNYVGNYESEHKPKLNEGVVIKVNANQRYTTNAPGIVLIQQLAALADVKLQLFVVQNDSPCGGTVGPMLAGKLGVRTLDLGNPQWSMHSIRETGGTKDVDSLVHLFQHFFARYTSIAEKIYVE